MKYITQTDFMQCLYESYMKLLAFVVRRLELTRYVLQSLRVQLMLQNELSVVLFVENYNHESARHVHYLFER